MPQMCIRDRDRLMLLGHNQNEIDEKLASLNIEHIKEGVTGEDALIVEQLSLIHIFNVTSFL